MASTELTPPALIYDGECRFCCAWVRRWQSAIGPKVEFIALQDPSVPSRFPTIKTAELARAIHWVDSDGSVYQGAEAVFRLLRHDAGNRWWLWLYYRLPGFSFISESSYRFVADHRLFFGSAQALLTSGNASHIQLRNAFLRGLGLIYFIAFASLWPQLPGLAGPNGIAPASQLIDFVRSQYPGWQHLYQIPTFCWLGTGDLSLRLQCGAGLFFAILLLLGRFPAFAAGWLWLLYLSLTTACGVFLEFQWDNLLLETGFLAIFFAPLERRLSIRTQPSLLILWLIRWLVFRIMLQSGLVKLLSGDETWRHFRSLQYHFETQPLPSWIGWYAHQMTGWVQVLALILMFAIEIVFPFLIFFGRKGRVLAATGFIVLQTFIALTGNYGFFNLLTILISLALLDDGFLQRCREVVTRFRIPFERARSKNVSGAPNTVSSQIPRFQTATAGRRWPAWLVVPITTAVLLISIIEWAAVLRLTPHLPSIAVTFYRWGAPFRSVNNYGLFAVMTTTRPEIIIEGSMDGQHWIPYQFRYKPVDLEGRPRFVAPHQPRLDWQMWFAALGSYNENPWFLQFCWKLLNGSPEVLRLLAGDPFPKPPKYIRALKYEYHFTSQRERRVTGDWWRRRLLGYYCPILKLPQTPPLQP